MAVFPLEKQPCFVLECPQLKSKIYMSSQPRYKSLDEATRPQKPLAFSSMIKPMGSACNLDCPYCYYLDKKELYGGYQPRMNEALLEQYIKQYIQANEVPLVTFVWHGGEPLLAGVDYYRKAMEFQKKYQGDKEIENTLQTNGTLISEEWCLFWKEHQFLIGLSIDGPADIHDSYRVDKGGNPTFERVMQGVEMMKRYGVEFNTLTALNAKSAGRGVEIYQFLKSIGSHYMQFLPVLEHTLQAEGARRPHIVPPHTEGSVVADWSISAEDFGQFMIDVFDEWVISDVAEYYVQLFDTSLANWVGAMPGLCSFARNCGHALAVEHNGDVYSCDHFVYPEYKLGNIQESSLSTMLQSDKQKRFGLQKSQSLPKECKRCKFHFACHGECPKHRFAKTRQGKPGLNALCAGFRMYFEHIEPYMEFMAAMLAKEKPPALVMIWARQRLAAQQN